MPFLVLLFVVAWLDRINVGFARLQMVKDLGFTDAVYGFGAGIFYLGYLLFEVPSNLVLERIGARKTFARITILWGLTTIATMLVTTATSFYIFRFLLGAFEAGLLPGAVLYLTYWFPARRRAQMVGLFLTAIPIAGVIGGPLSGWIMGSLGGRVGLANWQWVFLLEGIPSIVMGLLTFKLFTDKPSRARWLTEKEKRLVLEDLEADYRNAGPRHHGLGDALKLPRVWLLTLIQFCLTSANPTAFSGAQHRRCDLSDMRRSAFGPYTGTTLPFCPSLPGLCRRPHDDWNVLESSCDRFLRAGYRNNVRSECRCSVLAVSTNAVGRYGRSRWHRAH